MRHLHSLSASSIWQTRSSMQHQGICFLSLYSSIYSTFISQSNSSYALISKSLIHSLHLSNLHFISIIFLFQMFKDYHFQFLIFNWFLVIFTCIWFSYAKIPYLFHRFGILFCRCSYLLYISKYFKLWFLKYFQISVISMAINYFTFQVYLMRLLVSFLSKCVNRIRKLISWGSFHFLPPLTSLFYFVVPSWPHLDIPISETVLYLQLRLSLCDDIAL